MCRDTTSRSRFVTIHPTEKPCKKSDFPATCSNTRSTNRSTRSNSFHSTRENELCPVTGILSDINEDYHIMSRVLGSGHYGSVRECVNRTSRRWYAVKSVQKSKIGRLDHLKREVALLSKINHSNIIKLIDCYEDEDHVHIITEKYTGGELFDKIIDNTKNDGCFTEVKSANIIKSILNAVAYLHANDIVHRDIKPENILFETQEDESPVKLIDFGLSRIHRHGEPLMSNPVGTAYYMAPELLKGKYDLACDIWSIGVVAYILICGYPPFNGDTDKEIFESIKKGTFVFPTQGWNGISAECKDFIRCLLRKDPRKRFTAEEALMHPWLKHSCIYSKKEELLARISKLQISVKAMQH